MRWCISCNHAIIHSNWIGDWCRWSRLNPYIPLYRESVNRRDIRSLGVKASAPTAHTKNSRNGTSWMAAVRPGFPFSPPPSTRSNSDRPDVPLLTPVGASEWRGPAGCPSPSAQTLALRVRALAASPPVHDSCCGLPRCPPAPVLHRRRRATSPVLHPRSRHCVACNSAGSGPPPMPQHDVSESRLVLKPTMCSL